MLCGFGIIFIEMIICFFVIIWYRRTNVLPFIKQIMRFEEKIEKVFKQYARVEPKFDIVLKDCDF